jgi:ABC-type polysaccharide/polyol phosphate export permease
MTHLVVSYQEVLFTPGPFTRWFQLLAVGAGSLFVFIVGYFVFDRLRDTLAEEV